MKLGIMQPYFFPYIGHFELIFRVDQWVVFDTAQYIKLGWVNRNRILHPVDGWQYIIVPIRKHNYQAAIKDIKIVEDNRWHDKLLRQLQHYKKRAPYFSVVMDIVTECLRVNDDSLSRLNVRCLDRVCAYLEIPFQFSIFSEMRLDLGPVEGPGDWALRIAEALGVSEYINAPGGANLFDRSKFEVAGITLTIQAPVDFVYTCGDYTFQSNLSIIDVLMWHPPEAIHAYLAARSQGE